eukprot:jgi/Tetstr1/447647/TSEL_035006.t1
MASPDLRPWLLAASAAAASSVMTVLVVTDTWRPTWHAFRRMISSYALRSTPPRACQCCGGSGGGRTPIKSDRAASDGAPVRLGSAVKRANQTDPSPRTDYLPWEEYFMSVAVLSAQRSKDPNKQVGACIVSKDKIILGIGYNGFPRGCPDDKLSWAKKSESGNPLATKYPYVCHAEMNAIMNKNSASVSGSSMYVTMFPCNECAKLMIQAGIEEVVFLEGKVNMDPAGSPGGRGTQSPDPCYEAARCLMDMAGVSYRQLTMDHELYLLTDQGSPY